MPEAQAISAAWLIEEWTSTLGGAIELMTEARPGLKGGSPLPAGSPEIPGDALWQAIPLSIGSDTVFFLAAPGESWLHIGKSAMLAAGVTEANPEDARVTYLEIVVQAASGLAQAIGGRIGAAVSILPAKQIQLGAEGLAEATIVHPLDVTLGETPPVRLYLGWSQQLESALKPKPSEPPEVAPKPPSQLALPQQKSRTLDLLMEVEMPVSVSFGRAQLPLRDVLKLNSGSIVELNRTINDPVEIIVNNCVIARGEVVVVEGNYGVRIQHVISREERLRTLK